MEIFCVIMRENNQARSTKFCVHNTFWCSRDLEARWESTRIFYRKWVLLERGAFPADLLDVPVFSFHNSRAIIYLSLESQVAVRTRVISWKRSVSVSIICVKELSNKHHDNRVWQKLGKDSRNSKTQSLDYFLPIPTVANSSAPGWPTWYHH